ncbi:NAD-dependent epimerase/dehydratase family protein [Paenibacillus methanolicus]|uniref:UDP-glucose 4-epimerase n=1 Tax=Paenibacillus methanolicus TaxID=582686 RepID=A0A5S5BSD6_9BACL|nr:NAD-dependent epimerase/dehydratase family protein [Paenibacillus methanolicus]TYP70101.1 UDP-glucose 4-epimerase [Paenibacillus methanolicus]
MSNVIVTGGAGFIGSHLVDRLIAEGHRVLVVDNLSTGDRRNVHPEAEVVELDLLHPNLTDVCRSFRPEVVFHEAASVSVAQSMQRPDKDAANNVTGTIYVLEACKASGARKLVYASSAAVYGNPVSALVSERHPIRPQSYYGISKYAPEQYIRVAAETSGMDYTILRYSNVYGSRQGTRGEGGVVSIFASRLRKGEPCVIFGDGQQTRDFVYVKDVVAANIAALTQGGGRTINVSSCIPTSVNQLLRTMCGLLDKPFAPKYMSGRPGDIRDSLLDNGLATTALDWRPSYSLREGLAEMLEEERARDGVTADR